MDDAGWRARQRARKELERPHMRGVDGQWVPVEQEPMPMQEGFIGGFHPDAGPPVAPPPPPKDHRFHLPGHADRHQRDDQAAPSSWVPTYPDRRASAIRPAQLARLSAVERSQKLKGALMTPHLQFMAGPLLRFDTIDEHGVWCGAVMVVTADAGSIYDPHPTLTYEWDPDDAALPKAAERKAAAHRAGQSFDLGPHPADPQATMFASANGRVQGPNAQIQSVRGQELWVYAGNGGTFTFWRFMLRVPLGNNGMKVEYNVNNGQELEFYVPARNENMRFAAYSCNGFSSGVNPDTFRGVGFKTGYDPVWMDLLAKHAELPFHALVGGGDQLYCDGITREPELQEWVTMTNNAKKKVYELTDEIRFAVDRFYFNHYCASFRSGAFARANSSIPMMNMLDDHDLIDGFGSYPDDLQNSPVFKHIGTRGYFFFLLFQCFITPEVDGLDDTHHSNKSIIIGGPGPYIPFPSHSFLANMGPQTWMLMLDCRAERKKDQVCSPTEYQKVMARLKTMPEGVKHLFVLIGIPIAYPRLVFLETALESKLNPFISLARSGTSGVSSFFNKFNQDAELLDDLSDHWTAKSHKKERNWFVEQLQNFALARKIRVSFVSGDVHCAAVGVFKTLVRKNQPTIAPEEDHRYMLNIVTSAIVNTPPPGGVITMVGTLASKTHRTMHYCDTDETMVPLFAQDTTGGSPKNKYIMGKRNWTSCSWDAATGDIVFDVRVEKEKGNGETVGYAVRAPAPRW